jgi:hypothetical protein
VPHFPRREALRAPVLSANVGRKCKKPELWRLRLFSGRAPALLRAGYSTASGDVGAEARITWIEGMWKSVVYASFFKGAILLSVIGWRKTSNIDRSRHSAHDMLVLRPRSPQFDHSDVE